MRLNWGKTFLIGFGFLSISAATSLYDSYMPIFYKEFIASSFLVGLLMGVDNFLGFTLQPYIGALSDTTNNRWGRRRPYVLVGLPIALLMLMTIPFARHIGLPALLGAALIMNLAIAFFRSPVVALMPDMTPAPNRSLANGVINLMGGVGAAVVVLLGQRLYPMNNAYPFFLAGGVMTAVLLLYIFAVREPARPHAGDGDDELPQNILGALKDIITAKDKSTLVMLTSIFLLFVGYQAVQTWFTTFGVNVMGIRENEASGILTFFIGAFIVGALPAGLLGGKIGRRNTIVAGMGGMIACFIAVQFLYTDLALFKALLVVGGLCFALVSINIYPMVVQMCSAKQTGAYTGLYYIFSGIAGTAGPAIFGLMFDLAGTYEYLFLWSSLFIGLALITMMSVKQGEAAPQSGGQVA